MLAVKFEGAANIAGQNSADVFEPFPIQVLHPEGTHIVLSCWQLTEKERADIAAGKPLWLAVQTYGQPIHPFLMSTERPSL